MKVNFSMKLPGTVLASAVRLSERLVKQYQCHFVLRYGATCHPHVTMWAAEVPDRNLSALRSKLAQLVTDTKPLTCIFAGMDTHQRYIGVNLARTDDIMLFHQQVVEVAAPYRQRTIHAANEYRMDLNEAQLASIVKFGYPDVGKLFQPHFTLTRTINGRCAEKAIMGVSWSIPEFTVESFGLYTMGDHGVTLQQLSAFPAGHL